MDTPFDFQWNEWKDAFAHFSAKSIQAEQDKAIESLSESYAYFQSKFPDPEEAEYKRRRFVKAMIWHEKNAKHFDYGKVSVVGARERLTSNALVIALWRLFSLIPDDDFSCEPTLSQVMQVVDEEIKMLTGQST